MGVPFMRRNDAGSDLLKRNGNLREFSSPVNEERLVAVRALRPGCSHPARAARGHRWERPPLGQSGRCD